MEVKRIQLRGISRTPSDRMTEDGGCAESLNVSLDNTELVPVLQPKDITEDLGLPSNKEWKDIFIHKTYFAENYILVKDNISYLQLVIWRKDKNDFDSLISLGAQETISGITSVGNTLVVSTNKRLLYLLYKDGEYQFIGDGVPKIALSFVNYSENRGYAGNFPPYLGATVVEEQTNLQFGTADSRYEVTDDRAAGALNKIWDAYQELIGKNLFLGYLNAPIFVRYAIKLYDGSYLDASSPILLGGAFNEKETVHSSPLEVYYKMEQTESRAYDYTFQIRLRDAYRIGVYKDLLDVDLLRNWSDIIESVDVFVSPVVNLFPNGNHAAMSESRDDQTGSGYDYSLILDPETTKDEEKVKECLFSASTFFKIKSYTIGDLTTNNAAIEVLKEDLTGENLWSDGNRMKEAEISTSILADKLSTYNNSILALGGKIILPSVKTLHGQHAFHNSVANKYAFRYYISSPSTSGLVVYSENYQETALSPFISPKTGYYTEQSGQILTVKSASCEPFTMLTYPDSRCSKVDICKMSPSGSVEGVCTLEMHPHPYVANCSYAWVGMGKSLASLTYVYTGSDFKNDVPESRTESVPNKLLTSLMDKPFVFPTGKRYTFQGNVMGCAAATTPLSQGQFGQFGLYVFTDEGIWAMKTSDTGELLSSSDLSREICSSPESITPLDQSVIFVTKKGLMQVKGSEIFNLSQNMMGRHYTIESTAKAIIDALPLYCKLADHAADKTPFITFLEGARFSYDYAGERIICVNPNENYQFVYKLSTDTWHKISSPLYRLSKPLNSYPESLIMGKDEDGYTKVIKMSNILDNSEGQATEPAIIVTRPFDLGEPDVFKTIKEARVRGQYPKGAVNFILLGSNDGINFYTISTLRGKSWKLFRMVILANLDKNDRISWVDVQFETRFKNKLR